MKPESDHRGGPSHEKFGGRAGSSGSDRPGIRIFRFYRGILREDGPTWGLALAVGTTLAACGGPPAAVVASPATPSVVPEAPYPTPEPELRGIHSSGSVAVGAKATLRATGIGGLDGVRWSLEDPTKARFIGADVGPTATIEVLAPGPVRIAASLGGGAVRSLLAGVPSPSPGRRIDLTAYGIGEDGRGARAYEGESSRVITSEAGWRSFAAGFRGAGGSPAPPKDLREAPPPVNFATSSLVLVFEILPSGMDPPPVLTRIDAGLAEVVVPLVNHGEPTTADLATYLLIYEVGKLPEGAKIRVIRE